MPTGKRPYLFARALVVLSIVWGFAVPIVHLACGMAGGPAEVMCEDGHGMPDAAIPLENGAAHVGHDTHHDSGTSSHHHMPSDDGTIGNGHHAPASKAHPCPQDTGVDAREAALECCWVDANAADRRAQLPNLTQLADPAAATVDIVAVPENASVMHADAGHLAAPPISFRLLFSVFLI